MKKLAYPEQPLFLETTTVVRQFFWFCRSYYFIFGMILKSKKC
jgi:hypothetical protein